MTVAQTFPKTLISDLRFFKKMANQPESLPFYSFCISNWSLRKHIEWRNRVFTRISADNPLRQYCHKFTLEPFIVISGGWAMQTSCKWSTGFSWAQRIVNEYVHRFCTSLFNFYVRKCHLNSVIYHSHVSPTWSCEPVSTSKDFFFVLHKIHISKKQSMMRWMLVRLTLFKWEFYDYLDSHKILFGSIHGWLW